ncbi:hypothetical protein ACGC1H_005311 [Rhizoctonia solani]
MWTTKILNIEATLVHLLYLWMSSMFTLVQGDTAQNTALALSTTESLFPSVTNELSQSTTTQASISLPVFTSSTYSESFTITASPTVTTITQTNTESTTLVTAGVPTVTGPTCEQRCLAQVANSVGCGNMSNLKCICPRLNRYLSDAEACMWTQHCLYYLWIEAFQQVETACSRLQPNFIVPGPAISSGTFQIRPEAVESPNPPTNTRFTPVPTAESESVTTTRVAVQEQTQTIILTPGQIVTFTVSGTVMTTFTASYSPPFTATRVARKIQRDEEIDQASFESGVGNRATKTVEYGFGEIFELFGLLLSILLVL